MKKLLSLLCVFAIMLSVAGCGQNADPTEAPTNGDNTQSSLTGQVTAIDGSVVTLILGVLSPMADFRPDGNIQGNPGDMPSMPGNSGGFDQLVPDSTAPAGSGSPDGEGGTPPQMPDGETGGTPPEMPNGEMGGTPPEMPNGETGGTPPQMPSGEMGDRPMGDGMPGNFSFFAAGTESISLDLSGAKVYIESMGNTTEAALTDIAINDILVIALGENDEPVTVTIQEQPQMGDPGQQGQMGKPGGFGGSMEVTQGTAANTLNTDSTYTSTIYSSTGDDENALRIDGATVTLENITVSKDGGATSNTENGDFYGMNAALLATNGANVTIRNSTVNSSAQNGNGVFSYGSGTVVTISDSVITTTKDNSGGIQTTGGGTTNAFNLTITTEGNSSAAIRSDRGGGTVTVDGGTYTSNGYNSPAVYSTADITVKNAILTANNSEALVIEGKNSITLENCDVYGCMSETKSSSANINVHNVMIYQSMSGDADVGTSLFSMTAGTVTGEKGDMFYVTNTRCIMKLSGVTFLNKDTEGYFLLVSGNDASRGWGTAGANGGQVELTAENQTIEGKIGVDSISSLNMILSKNSILTACVNILPNGENGANSGITITIEQGCTWNLTGDCTITSLTNHGTINFNGYTITLADGTVLSK